MSHISHSKTMLTFARIIRHMKKLDARGDTLTSAAIAESADLSKSYVHASLRRMQKNLKWVKPTGFVKGTKIIIWKITP